ncbi:MAG TPA: AAA family ATPase, partial [Candidatus Babeliales bacterium]|nr:AAA family ATPase [Candidatus Babeliales bacterium]
IVGNRARRAYGKAIAYAQQLLVADPWREDTLRQLMSARYESGDAAGALSEFDRFARLLRDQMNAVPMHETIALRDAVARGAPIPGTSDAPKAPKKREALAAPFVGRERELEELHTHWSRAASGSGSLVLVRGDAGIGKSRLVSELALVVESEGGRVIEGATSLPERGPYESVTEAMRQGLTMIAALPLPPAVLAAAAGLVPELRTHRPELPILTHLDERSERERLFDAVAQVLVALSRPRPLLVILEDVQWADAATLELIGLLAQRVAGAPVFVIATCREGQVALPPVLRSVVRVMLGPLDSSAVAALAATIAPAGAPDGALVRAVFERSGGNPLFVTEMLRDAARGVYDAAVIPESIAAMIVTRIEPLKDATQKIAQVAAVAGAAFAFDVVREATGFSDTLMLAGLDELLDRHLIRESTERGRYEYAFTHDLVRQAIYDAISPDARMRRHLRVARVIENAYANEAVKPAVEIALHYDRGGDALAAAQWYLLAAQRAASLYANGEARDLATRGSALTAGNDRLRFELLLIRQEMNVRLGERAPQSADLAEIARCSSLLDDEAALTALRLQVNFTHSFCDLEEEAAAVSRLRERAESTKDVRWKAVAIELEGAAALRRADVDAILACGLAAKKLYERLGDPAGKVRALTIASIGCAGFGRHEQAFRCADEARRIGVSAGDPALELSALTAAILQACEIQQFAHAAELSREQLALSRSIGHRFTECSAHGNLADALKHLWQVDQALEHFRTAIALEKAMSLSVGYQYLARYAALLGALGEFDEALRLFGEAESLSRRIRRPGLEIIAASLRAEMLWQRGATAPMRRAVAGVLELARGFERRPWWWFSFALNEARLLRYDGRFLESAELLESNLPDMRRFSRPLDELSATDELAATNLAANRLQEAVGAVESASVLVGRIEDPTTMLHPVEHHWIAYRVYRAAGDDARAAAALNAAERSYEQRRDAIGDPSLRASFEAIPLHRELRAALEPIIE